MDKKTLYKIFEKTDGHCHLCHQKISFSKYNEKGGWEIDHSKAKAEGGKDHVNNYFPAHITCNRRKGKMRAKNYRFQQGINRPPYSKKQKEEMRSGNRTTGAVIGSLVGAPLGGFGALVGGIVGLAIGDSSTPEK